MKNSKNEKKTKSSEVSIRLLIVREKKGKQKININEKDEVEIKPFTKRKTNEKEQLNDAPKTNAKILRYKVRSWTEFNREYFCKSGHYNIINPKRLIDNKNT